MKTTHAGTGFEIDLGPAWRALRDQFAEDDEVVFANDALKARLFISGGLIHTEGRDLRELAVGMNAAVRQSITGVAPRQYGAISYEDNVLVFRSPRGVDVVAKARAQTATGAETMLVITIVHRHVCLYARLRSEALDLEALRALWVDLRADLFVAEAA